MENVTVTTSADMSGKLNLGKVRQCSGAKASREVAVWGGAGQRGRGLLDFREDSRLSSSAW